MVAFTISERLQLPRGFSDKWGKPLRKQRLIEGQFRAYGYYRDYTEIETPILELSSALPREAFSCWKENGFIPVTLLDLDQNYEQIGSAQAVLRPEGTIPVCRWLATRLAEGENVLPAKLIYTIDCYRNEPLDEIDDFKLRQFNQLGVEYIGNASTRADVEVINYAYDTMKEFIPDDEDIRIRVGNVALFNNLCVESGLSNKQRVSLQNKLDEFSKARALGEVETIELPEIQALDEGLQERWSALTTTYEKFDSKTNRCPPDMESWRLWDLLERLDEDNIPTTADLSIVRGFNYYTGPVFQFDARTKDGTWIAEIGGGGRYDDLIGQNLRTFGIEKKVAATGFAFGTERLVKAARFSGELE